MLQATHEIIIGSKRYSSPTKSRLIRLNLSIQKDTLVNLCNFTFGPQEELDISPGEDIKVKLGTGQDNILVFTGKIELVEWHLNEVRIEAASNFRKMVHLHYNMYFEQSPAGSIVRSICSEAEMKVGQADPGLSFEYYALGSNHNVADHIRMLARQCGFDAYADEEDKLIFTLPIPKNVHLMQYGVNVLSLSLQNPAEGVGVAEVYGESPASYGQGAAAATWLTRKEVKGSASEGDGVTVSVFDPTIRTIDQANVSAPNYLATFKARVRGSMVILGDPSIKMGDAVQISQMPVSNQNGQFKVVGIEHKITRKLGFITQLNIEEI